jgi:hypothetical protein
MTKDEISKILYKEKPLANLIRVFKTKLVYETKVEDNTFTFEVPIDELPEAGFEVTLPAQFLRRWVIIK